MCGCLAKAEEETEATVCTNDEISIPGSDLPRPLPHLLPREPLHRNPCKPRLRVDEDDVEAAAYRPAALPAAGGDESHAVTQLDEFLLGDGTDTNLDEVAQDVVVLLQDADDGGVPQPPSPGLPVVTPVLAGRAAVLPVLPSIGQRVAALEAVRDSFLHLVLHLLSRFTA